MPGMLSYTDCSNLLSFRFLLPYWNRLYARRRLSGELFLPVTMITTNEPLERPRGVCRAFKYGFLIDHAGLIAHYP